VNLCKDCGEEIDFIKSWRGVWVVLDPNPSDSKFSRESYVEIAVGEFVSVFRHQCAKRLEEKTQRAGRSWKDK
jgi:hypothetical protein